jgi:DNA-binding NarL/FixJ family response regulator
LIVGKSILLRGGLARISRSVNFRSVASVSCVDRFPKGNHLYEAVPRSEDSQAILVTENTIGPQLFLKKKSILRCLIEGHSNKCMARKIDIAEATVSGCDRVSRITAVASNLLPLAAWR